MLGLGPLETTIAIAAVAAGACLQGSAGFGLGMLAAPILVLMDPGFVPAPMMVNACVLSALLLLRERHAVRLGPVRWALVGNVAGTAVAAVTLRSLDARGFSLLFGALVLVAVGLSASGLHLRVGRRSSSSAGTASGFMGTTSSIGGPPMALLFQRESGPTVRGTLAAYFVASNLIGLSALALIGRFGEVELQRSLLLVPGTVVGFAVSSWLTGFVDGRAVRPILLGVCAISGAMVILRTLLG